MKNFIAFHGGQNSGICTHTKAVDWAENLMTKTNAGKVMICEVIETVERESPPFVVKRYEAPVEPRSVEEIVEANAGHFDQMRKSA